MTTVNELIAELQFEADHGHGDMEVVLVIGHTESEVAKGLTVEFTDEVVVVEA
jgi:hypothetical protein